MIDKYCETHNKDIIVTLNDMSFCDCCYGSQNCDCKFKYAELDGGGHE